MIYHFGPQGVEGGGSLKQLLGGKGANLAEMTTIGLPVPPGFTIPTTVCAEYYRRGGKLPAALMKEVRRAMRRLEKEMGKRFGDSAAPLLVSVRSGAAVSMPGMMDTVLNLGLNARTVAGLEALTGDCRFAHDAYRRLVDMFGDVVMGLGHEGFERALGRVKGKHGVESDAELDAEALREVVAAYRRIYRRRTAEDFPEDPMEQLERAIEAVFKSWNAPRAVRYREIRQIAGLAGTAVTVQTMVFGNMGKDSGSGVAFTRDPATGDNELYGEFLVNAQGEDVVAGIRTPRPIRELVAVWPRVAAQLQEIKEQLERHYREVQDFEFTVERGTLYVLQTRTGQRTGQAAVKIACDLVSESLIDERTAVLRVPPDDLTQLLLPSFDPKARRDVVATGLPASPGAAVGCPAFTAAEAADRAHAGEKVLLVRKETSPEDIDGMHAAEGILTSRGGMTSHAAVVARGWGKPCVVGAGRVEIDEVRQRITVGARTFGSKDKISIDGTSGQIMAGEVPTITPRLSAEFATLMRWADRFRGLEVRANADTPTDAARARELGAEGIGLCRTEHMFFEGERIQVMREMILSEDEGDRRRALAKLLPYQRQDFVGIFEAMRGRPVTVRLVDPPLHEFLPHDGASQRELARRLGVPAAKLKRRVAQLQEVNPMLGHRGCRLAISYPEILEMQVQAIAEAAIECRRRRIRVEPEIMIPLVSVAEELRILRQLTERTLERVQRKRKLGRRLNIAIGTMIEVPRAAVTAEEVAAHADFFSFGTNDLTQLTFGFSRDDVGAFLGSYLAQGIMPGDPFQSLDVDGVGRLVGIAVDRGRQARENLKVGICGEHGGDPASIGFFHNLRLDYISCSPFRVPIARLAASQAALREGAAIPSEVG